MAENLLHEREYLLGQFAEADVEIAKTQYASNLVARDLYHEKNVFPYYEKDEVVGIAHVDIPRILADKMKEIEDEIFLLLTMHTLNAKSASDIPYVPAINPNGMMMAFHEAFRNAVIHGIRYDAAQTVRVHLKIWQDVVGTWRKLHIAMRITDSGGGFDLAAVSDPTDNLQKVTGRGLAMMMVGANMQYVGKGNEVLLSQVWEQNCEKAEPAELSPELPMPSSAKVESGEGI